MDNTAYTEVLCPHCGRAILLPPDAENPVCMYCAQPVDPHTLLARAKAVSGESMETLLQEMEKLLPQDFAFRLALKDFNADAYPPRFQEYTVSMAPAFAAYRNAAEADPEQAAALFSERFLTLFESRFQKEGIRKETDARLFDYRYAMVSFFIPALLEYGDAGDRLADSFLLLWNEKHPKNTLGKSDFKSICSGFRKKLCYITTAVCTSLGRPDDCQELNAFRSFRDGWLCRSPDGKRKIAEYYLFAPMVVRGINRVPHSNKIYREIWREYLSPCLADLQADRPLRCAQRYEAMMRELERRYL